MFYLDETNSIRNAIFKCNPSTGLYMDQDTAFWPVVAEGAPKPHNNSGMTVFNRGDHLGYRLYYHDENMHLNELSYDPDEEIWSYEGVINQDVPSNNAIAATPGKDNGNFTVVTPRDDKNIQLTRWGLDRNWYICKLSLLVSCPGPNVIMLTFLQQQPPTHSKATSAPTRPPPPPSRSTTPRPTTTPSPSGPASPNRSASASTPPGRATCTTSAATSHSTG